MSAKGGLPIAELALTVYRVVVILLPLPFLIVIQLITE